MRARAAALVERLHAPVAHSMALEDQTTDQPSTNDRREIMIDELISNLDPDLWRDERCISSIRAARLRSILMRSTASFQASGTSPNSTPARRTTSSAVDAGLFPHETDGSEAIYSQSQGSNCCIKECSTRVGRGLAL